MNWHILYNYMRGKCSGEEIELLQQWLQQDPANEDFFKTFVESWDEEPVDFDVDVQKEWQKFKVDQLSKEKSPSHTDSAPASTRTKQKISDRARVTRHGNLIWYFSTALAALLILAVVFVIQNQREVSPQKTEKITYRTVATTQGERTNLRLKDGTEITLNAESSIRIPDNYGKTSRRIYLQGEAFFTVTHNDSLPFLVIANGALIKDLGTAFNINAYDSSRTEIAVKEGAVSLQKVKKGKSEQNIVKLHANEIGVFTHSGKPVISTINNISLFTGWTKGKLVFDDTPFPMVVKRLERWFNIDGKIADSTLNDRTLTATYDNMSINNVLEILALSLHLSYSRDQNTIIFKDKKSTQ